MGGRAHVTQATSWVAACWCERAVSGSQVKVLVGICGVGLFCLPVEMAALGLGWMTWWRKAWQPSTQSGWHPLPSTKARAPRGTEMQAVDIDAGPSVEGFPVLKAMQRP